MDIAIPGASYITGGRPLMEPLKTELAHAWDEAVQVTLDTAILLRQRPERAEEYRAMSTHLKEQLHQQAWSGREGSCRLALAAAQAALLAGALDTVLFHATGLLGGMEPPPEGLKPDQLHHLAESSRRNMLAPLSIVADFGLDEHSTMRYEAMVELGLMGGQAIGSLAVQGDAPAADATELHLVRQQAERRRAEADLQVFGPLLDKLPGIERIGVGPVAHARNSKGETVPAPHYGILVETIYQQELSDLLDEQVGQSRLKVV